MPRLWFKSKRYGWGWTPVTWEGWLVVAISIALAVAWVFIRAYLLREGTDTSVVKVMTALWFCGLIAGVTIIGYAKGEPPRWRWGPDD